MDAFQCKMCGGNLVPGNHEGAGTCDSCGTVMTLPKISDDRKLNLYNRANHFRMLKEFDKALAAYEMILNEDNEESEAHWGVVLSRYGIEYVEDPSTHKRMPTCNRMQVESVLNDPDYLLALEYVGDGYSRSLYEAEAKAISEIQRGILSISSKEDPYDVFICYKEQSESGQRTRDSAFAQDIYYQLKQEGYRVFFSRISLEDKLGQEYEPYIFSALTSAKVMVVVGTKPEYFNAVWVKNEWSRYLKLMKQQRSRVLIPCYRDMDAYDLPKELSLFQSLDMSKIGFLQDLVRGVKKLIDLENLKKDTQLIPLPTNNQSTGVASLLDRAFMFLEDGEFDKAEEYFEKVLDQEPKNGKAYFGKFLVENTCTGVDCLIANAEESWFMISKTYQKAVSFANDELKKDFSKYKSQVRQLQIVKQQEKRKFDILEERKNLELRKEEEEKAQQLREMEEQKNQLETLKQKRILKFLLILSVLLVGFRFFTQ